MCCIKWFGVFITVMILFSCCSYGINPADAYGEKKIVSMDELEKRADVILGDEAPKEAKPYVTLDSLIHHNETLLMGDVYDYINNKVMDAILAVPPAVRPYALTYAVEKAKNCVDEKGISAIPTQRTFDLISSQDRGFQKIRSGVQEALMIYDKVGKELRENGRYDGISDATLDTMIHLKDGSSISIRDFFLGCECGKRTSSGFGVHLISHDGRINRYVSAEDVYRVQVADDNIHARFKMVNSGDSGRLVDGLRDDSHVAITYPEYDHLMDFDDSRLPALEKIQLADGRTVIRGESGTLAGEIFDIHRDFDGGLNLIRSEVAKIPSDIPDGVKLADLAPNLVDIVVGLVFAALILVFAFKYSKW